MAGLQQRLTFKTRISARSVLQVGRIQLVQYYVILLGFLLTECCFDQDRPLLTLLKAVRGWPMAGLQQRLTFKTRISAPSVLQVGRDQSFWIFRLERPLTGERSQQSGPA